MSTFGVVNVAPLREFRPLAQPWPTSDEAITPFPCPPLRC